MYNYLNPNQEYSYIQKGNQGLLAACLIAILEIKHPKARVQIGNDWVYQLFHDELDKTIILLEPLMRKINNGIY